MAEVRVKLTEVDGNRLELRLENTMISNANEGIYTVSPGKARGSPPVAAQLNSPMKKALDAAEANPVAVEASPNSRESAPDAEASASGAAFDEIEPVSPRSPPPVSQSKDEEPESRCPRCT